MQESAAEANASATEEEVDSAVERNIILWLTNVSHGVNHFQNQMMVVLYPVIMPELGFGYAELGVLLAVQSMLGGATQGFYGFATPFLPRTWLLGIGNLVLGFGTLATGFVNSFGGIISTRGVASVGASAQHPVGYSLLAGYFPSARGKIIGLNSSISNVGSLLAPLTAGAMLVIMSWRQVFMIVAALSIAMGLVYFLFRKRVDTVTSQGPTSKEKLMQSTSSYLRVFRNRNMIFVSLVMMVGGAGRGGGGMVAFMAVYFANDLGLSTFTVAMAITTLGLGGVIGPIGFGWLSDRLSRTGILQLSLCLSALATVWVAFQGSCRYYC